MSQPTIAEALHELVSLVTAGKPMEAFEKFYHQDLEKTDLDGVLVQGKDQSRQIGLQLLSRITNVREFSHQGTVIVGQRSYLVWRLDFDLNDGSAVKLDQVAIQDWQHGKIIRERFIA